MGLTRFNQTFLYSFGMTKIFLFEKLSCHDTLLFIVLLFELSMLNGCLLFSLDIDLSMFTLPLFYVGHLSHCTSMFTLHLFGQSWKRDQFPLPIPTKLFFLDHWLMSCDHLVDTLCLLTILLTPYVFWPSCWRFLEICSCWLVIQIKIFKRLLIAVSMCSILEI